MLGSVSGEDSIGLTISAPLLIGLIRDILGVTI